MPKKRTPDGLESPSHNHFQQAVIPFHQPETVSFGAGLSRVGFAKRDTQHEAVFGMQGDLLVCAPA